MKKTLKYTGIAILLLAILFFICGLVYPSFGYQNRVLINKPLTETFLKFTNPSNMKDWITGYKRMGWISGFPMQPGSKWYMIVEQHGKEYKMIETLTAFEPNSLFSFHLQNDVLNSDVAIHFLAKGSKTEIIADHAVKGKNLFWRSLFVFYQGYFSKTQQDGYDNLKKMIERN